MSLYAARCRSTSSTSITIRTQWRASSVPTHGIQLGWPTSEWGLLITECDGGDSESGIGTTCGAAATKNYSRVDRISRAGAVSGAANGHVHPDSGWPTKPNTAEPTDVTGPHPPLSAMFLIADLPKGVGRSRSVCPAVPGHLGHAGKG